MRPVLLTSIALLGMFTNAAHAQMICVTSQNGNGSRLVPARYGSCSNVSNSSLFLAKPFEVPDYGDNNNSQPRAFRLAYFYPDRTEAYYTSCSGTGMPTIQYVGPVQACGRPPRPATQ